MIYKPLLDRLSSASDHLFSVLEGLYISGNPDFTKLLAGAANELGDCIGGSERRSLVGQV